MSWNVATSPYAIAMRKIKTAAPSWRTSFGSERRSASAPAAPDASDFDADIVLLQGIINPRAMRRLFPARRWRFILSRRAVENMPKGSVFTAPVSSVETEAIAVRYREGLRITTRTGLIDEDRPAAPEGTAPPATGKPTSEDPGLAVKLLNGGRIVWLASVTLGADCAEACSQWEALTRWRLARRQAREGLIAGGRIQTGPEAAPCEKQSIEAEIPAATGAPSIAKGENRDLLGCVAELKIE